jgi:transposase
MLEYPSGVLQKIVLGEDKRWVWYRRGEDNPSAARMTAKHPPSLMIFAFIGVGLKSKLLILEGTIDGEMYRRNIAILAFMDELNQLHGLLQWIFQRVRASTHTARSTVAWLGHVCMVLARWPPNSPGLSPIELWAILKNPVTFLMPTTIEQLKQIVTHAWGQIPQRSIDRLCLSFPARLLLCRERCGLGISNKLSGIREFQALWDTWRDIPHSCTHGLQEKINYSFIHRPQPVIWELLEENRHHFRRSISNSGEKPMVFNAETQAT